MNVKRWLSLAAFVMGVMLVSHTAYAELKDIPLVVAKQGGGSTTYSLSVKIVALMTLLTVLPALLITTTAFTRIIIVLAILRQAIGIPNVPTNQILIGLALIMTLFVMKPIIDHINTVSVQPYLAGQITEEVALSNAMTDLKSFMLKQTHKSDLKLFYELSKTPVASNGDHPFLVVLPAYITSELKTSFEIGFLIFIPFLIIDLVVASILMSIGMMMLSPMIISLPFKILFFVLVDGWSLVAASLVTSFRM